MKKCGFHSPKFFFFTQLIQFIIVYVTRKRIFRFHFRAFAYFISYRIRIDFFYVFITPFFYTAFTCKAWHSSFESNPKFSRKRSFKTHLRILLTLQTFSKTCTPVSLSDFFFAILARSGWSPFWLLSIFSSWFWPNLTNKNDPNVPRNTDTRVHLIFDSTHSSLRNTIVNAWICSCRTSTFFAKTEDNVCVTSAAWIKSIGLFAFINDFKYSKYFWANWEKTNHQILETCVIYEHADTIHTCCT